MSDLVGNPEDRFSRVAAHLCFTFHSKHSLYLSNNIVDKFNIIMDIIILALIFHQQNQTMSNERFLKLIDGEMVTYKMKLKNVLFTMQ